MITISWWRSPLVMFAAVSALTGAILFGQQTPATPVFTAAQAAGGRGVYDQRCAGCHGPDLRGGNEAPQLAGADFIECMARPDDARAVRVHSRDDAAWRGRSEPGTGAQRHGVHSSVERRDAGRAGARADDRTDHWRRRRGPAAGAGCKAGRAAPAAQAPAAQAPAAQTLGRPGPVARGLTVAGEVKNYMPVTDEMLRNPPPGDWLMARRNYQAWNYSPLTDITSLNVKDLKLAWVWAMRENVGANQPQPLVHNGTLYLVNPGNTVQALDAAHGRSDLGA